MLLADLIVYTFATLTSPFFCYQFLPFSSTHPTRNSPTNSAQAYSTATPTGFFTATSNHKTSSSIGTYNHLVLLSNHKPSNWRGTFWNVQENPD